MSVLIIEDAGYAAIMADPELANARRKLSLHEIRLIVRHARADPPKHVYWGAGEPDCPRDIKAGNGELHTLRCKVCGNEDARDQRCRDIASDLPSGRAALVEECARVAEEYPSTEYADIPVIRGIAHAIRNLSEKSKHYCVICAARWLKHADGTWSALTPCGPCCDNVPMDQAPINEIKADGMVDGQTHDFVRGEYRRRLGDQS